MECCILLPQQAVTAIFFINCVLIELPFMSIDQTKIVVTYKLSAKSMMWEQKFTFYKFLFKFD